MPENHRAWDERGSGSGSFEKKCTVIRGISKGHGDDEVASFFFLVQDSPEWVLQLSQVQVAIAIYNLEAVEEILNPEAVAEIHDHGLHLYPSRSKYYRLTPPLPSHNSWWEYVMVWEHDMFPVRNMSCSHNTLMTDGSWGRLSNMLSPIACVGSWEHPKADVLISC